MELLIVLAVFAVLTSIAVPSLSALQTNNRMVARINVLSVALHTARNEALKRGEAVSICKARADADGHLACDADARWDQGWIIFPASDATAKIRGFNGFSGNDQLRSIGDNARFTFNRYGFSNRQDTLVLCPGNGERTSARALLLERSGRVLLADDSDGNGVVEGLDGNDITCPSEG